METPWCCRIYEIRWSGFVSNAQKGAKRQKEFKQIDVCWGWALEDDRKTWVEVFDTRWSHAHQWAGAPTWQLSRYVLGLVPRYDLGKNHYVLNFHPGSLARAVGSLPLADGAGEIQVQWSRQDDGIRYSLTTPQPIWLHFKEDEQAATKIEAKHQLRLP